MVRTLRGSCFEKRRNSKNNWSNGRYDSELWNFWENFKIIWKSKFVERTEICNLLKLFFQSVSSTVFCILDFITSFPPLPYEAAEAIVQRSVVAMTTVRRNRAIDEDQINTLVTVQ